MKKIIIIGCPGSGKSTFARKLSDITNIPLYHLDMIWHKPDKTTLTKEEFDEQLMDLLQKSEWIIDGNYQRTLEVRIKECDTIFLLDIPLQTCLESVRARIGKKRNDLPWLEKELDEDFEKWIYSYPDKSLPKIYELLEKYADNKRIYIFKSRSEIDSYLKSLVN